MTDQLLVHGTIVIIIKQDKTAQKNKARSTNLEENIHPIVKIKDW
jgi:hypothetical protein